MALDLQKTVGRQPPLMAWLNFDVDNVLGESGVAMPAAVMPVNSIVVGGSLVITEAFNSGTSDEFAVGDQSDNTRYGSAINGATLGRTALTLTGHEYTSKDGITLRWTGSGADPTAGAGILLVEYVIADRATETEPVVTL